ncbi:hypothetical protein ABZ725_32575 [Streptomyces sp. NPDC006872]|uniref:ABC transporter ATP-binding protein n=1 Tax=Streptomyces sp. NPDC006872 TaxID=3155720 RepID=UPI0034033572
MADSVQQVTDDLIVMHRGRVVEHGTTDQVLTAPEHAYTRALLAAVPREGRRPTRHPCRPVHGCRACRSPRGAPEAFARTGPRGRRGAACRQTVPTGPPRAPRRPRPALRMCSELLTAAL